jgi:carboxyl-terminal processing protease
MDDGGAVILSVAKYYSPSGKAIQDGGITPSVQLAENDTTPDLDQDGNPLPGAPPKSTEDNLLKQSIELVTGKTTIAQLTNENGGPLNPVDDDDNHPIVQKSPKAVKPDK